MSWTIRTAATALREGKLTAAALLEEHLERIDRLEPTVRAWVLVDAPRARAEAARCDADLRAGHDRGLLHGIPLAVKDIIDVFDWPTACGSAQWKHAVARQDAPIVRSLRDAGAVLVGKTVTTQYASFDPPPTRNPWKLDRTPGGSSSGSAAAVATRMCVAALGSQTGGSITRPASYCGVYGCKPTYGLVPLDGILPLAPSMDHPGPMAACVHDLAIVLQVIAGPGLSQIVLPSETPRPPVVGRLRGLFDRRADEQTRAMLEDVCRELRAKGATIRETSLPPSFEDVIAQHRVVMAVESAGYHAERLVRHPEDYGPAIRGLIEEGLRASGPAYLRAKEHQARLKKDMRDLFNGVDALLVPATPAAAPDTSTTGDPAFNSPWSFTGLPVVSLPTCLTTEGLPLGVQLVGPAGDERGVFDVAAWAEQALGVSLGDPPCVR